MTITIRGIGWLTKDAYGCIAKGEHTPYGDASGPDSLAKQGIFAYPVKNFGRFDRVSRMTCFAVALAMRDAGIEYSAEQKQDIGIVATSPEGSLRTDVEYFRDYLKGGRTLSRGNLFIYTLPSSPAGEAAIHFGFLGPMLYAGGGKNPLVTVFDTAVEMVRAAEATMMTAGKADDHEALFFALGEGSGHEPAFDLAEVRSIISANPDVAGMVRKFFRVGNKKEEIVGIQDLPQSTQKTQRRL